MSQEHLPLDALQAWMQNALIFPGQTSTEQVEQLVEPSPRLAAVHRLAIYQRSYYLRLLTCMREQFPALCYTLGEELFDDFAYEYLQAHPSESYTLYELGKRLPAYLEETRPDREEPVESRERWVDFMVDLAHFERQLFVMFDAPGHEGKPFADLNVPDCRLRLQPCFALGDYRFPVAEYYHEVREGKAPPVPLEETSRVVLVRKNYLMRTVPLTTPHYTFLTSLHSGKNVSESLQLVAEQLAMPIAKVSQSWAAPDGTRQRWIEAGFFIVA